MNEFIRIFITYCILVVIFALPFAFIMLVQKVFHFLRGHLNANPQRNISLVSILLTIALAATLIILGERLLYDTNRWFNPLYATLPVEDLRLAVSRIINIGLRIASIVSIIVFVICSIAWMQNALFYKRRTRALVKILFTFSILSTLVILVLWILISYAINIGNDSIGSVFN